MCTLTMLARNPHVGLSNSRTALVTAEASYFLLVAGVSFWEGKHCSQGNLESREEHSDAHCHRGEAHSELSIEGQN